MGQFGFFDADRRLAAITAKGDPLEMIARVVPFESFRAEIEAAVLTPVSEKKSMAAFVRIRWSHGRFPSESVAAFPRIPQPDLLANGFEPVSAKTQPVSRPTVPEFRILKIHRAETRLRILGVSHEMSDIPR
jgi:hypothetical protein